MINQQFELIFFLKMCKMFHSMGVKFKSSFKHSALKSLQNEVEKKMLESGKVCFCVHNNKL